MLSLCSGFDDNGYVLKVLHVSQVFKEKRMWRDNTMSNLGVRKLVYLKKKKKELKKTGWKMLGRTSRGCGRVESII